MRHRPLRLGHAGTMLATQAASCHKQVQRPSGIALLERDRRRASAVGVCSGAPFEDSPLTAGVTRSHASFGGNSEMVPSALSRALYILDIYSTKRGAL